MNTSIIAKENAYEYRYDNPRNDKIPKQSIVYFHSFFRFAFAYTAYRASESFLGNSTTHFSHTCFIDTYFTTGLLYRRRRIKHRSSACARCDSLLDFFTCKQMLFKKRAFRSFPFACRNIFHAFYSVLFIRVVKIFVF